MRAAKDVFRVPIQNKVNRKIETIFNDLCTPKDTSVAEKIFQAPSVSSLSAKTDALPKIDGAMYYGIGLTR